MKEYLNYPNFKIAIMDELAFARRVFHDKVAMLQNRCERTEHKFEKPEVDLESRSIGPEVCIYCGKIK